MLNVAPAQSVRTELLGLTDVVICNENELAVMVGQSVAMGEEAAAARAIRCFADQLVVVTLGERGALGVLGDRTVKQSAFAVHSIDSTGAGDAFVAGFVCGRWWANGLLAALRLGCAAGALATTVAGAQPAMPRLSAVLDVLGPTSRA